jgi:hypothetical protein
VSTASVNGHTISRLSMPVPAWGHWFADVDLVEDVTLSGAVVIKLADVEAHGTVLSGGPYNGRSSYRIIGGAGGWGQEIPAKSYADDAGVKVATVVTDAALAIGEALADVPSTRRGPHYARAAGLASQVLHELAPRAWYVGLDGLTHFGSRLAATYAGDGVRTRVDPTGLVVDVATDAIASLVPGIRVDGSAPAVDVEYVLDDKRLTARVYAGPRTSRRLDAIRRIFDALDPRRPYRGVTEYRVVSQSGERLNLQPARASSGLGDLARVQVRPGVAGCRALVALGELVLVAFADSDPSRPCVIVHSAADSPGFMPLELDLGAAPRLGVARMTDPVVAGPFAGTITLGSTRIKAGL